MRYRLAVLIALSFLSAPGCAKMTHLTRTTSLPNGNTKGETVLIDAKQRAITNVKAQEINGSDLRVCAEPSPDALSALAASSGLSLSKQELANLTGNFSLAEGAGSIGLRTQSIQLMRDAMYRLCEGYLSGALDGLAFETLHRRFQSSMIAILAIEQLTGAVRPPTVVLGGSATQGNAEKAAELTEKTAAALQALRSAEKTLNTKEDALKTAAATREDLEKEEANQKKIMAEEDPQSAKARAAKTKLDEVTPLLAKARTAETEAKTSVIDAKKVKDDKQDSYDALDAARKAALAGGGAAAVQVTLFGDSAADRNQRADAAADAVASIVRQALELTFGKEFCATVLTKRPPSVDQKIFDRCLDYLGETVEGLKANRSVVTALTPEVTRFLQVTTALVADKESSPEKIQAATKAFESVAAALGYRMASRSEDNAKAPQTDSIAAVPNPPVPAPSPEVVPR